jgi:hypothetical protein
MDIETGRDSGAKENLEGVESKELWYSCCWKSRRSLRASPT